MNSENRTCQNCRKEFRIELEDSVFYEKIKVPPPTFCPECRMERRFVFRNERNLFRRKDAFGKEILSEFPSHAPLMIYDHDYWWSDQWDAFDYGKEYDFSRTFFEQFYELLKTVPVPSKSVIAMVDSEFCAQASYMKNCYLCFNVAEGENSAYLVSSYYTKDSFDLQESHHNELCYNNYMVDECYRVFFSVNCENCTDTWFSRDMIGCSNCFGCVNLRNKSYYIFNTPYTREEYKKYLEQFDSGSHEAVQKILKKAHEFWLKFPVRFTLGIRNMNSTGEHIQESRNVKESYCIHGGENLKYCQFLSIPPATDSYDYTNWGQASQIYEGLTCGGKVNLLKFCWECWESCRELEYCAFCPSSSNLFGCVGLKKKQYCILNKQYSKEDYFALRERIVKHMREKPYISEARNQTSEIRKIEYRYGEFFPPEFSPFAYNETLAHDFIPMTKEEAVIKGYVWREPELREYQTTLNAADLPDNIKDAKDNITKGIIKCSSCARAYRIIQMELDFYRRIGLPLPRLCPDCRFKERFTFVNPPKYWHGECDCRGQMAKSKESGNAYKNNAEHFHGDAPCPNEFETSFAPDRPEIVYCEECYKIEVA